MIFLSDYWALDPCEFSQKLLTDLVSFGPEMAITAGLADDAERWGLPIEMIGTTAMIPIRDLIVPSLPRYMGRYLGWYGLDAILEAARAADQDDDVDQIVFRVNSPGGSVQGLVEAANIIAGLTTPTIAYIDGTCASAAYFLACQCDRVIATDSAHTGSIGVRAVMFDRSAQFEQQGVKIVICDTGEFKSIGLPGQDITEEHKAEMQKMVDSHFADFKVAVQSGRGLTDEQFELVGDGRVFRNSEAIELGLVDEQNASVIQVVNPNPRRGRRPSALLASKQIISA